MDLNKFVVFVVLKYLGIIIIIISIITNRRQWVESVIIDELVFSSICTKILMLLIDSQRERVDISTEY